MAVQFLPKPFKATVVIGWYLIHVPQLIRQVNDLGQSLHCLMPVESLFEIPADSQEAVISQKEGVVLFDPAFEHPGTVRRARRGVVGHGNLPHEQSDLREDIILQIYSSDCKSGGIGGVAVDASLDLRPVAVNKQVHRQLRGWLVTPLELLAVRIHNDHVVPCQTALIDAGWRDHDPAVIEFDREVPLSADYQPARRQSVRGIGQFFSDGER